MGGEQKLVTTNRKAFYTYRILQRFEAGLVLVGSEVKSLREGRANLKDSYAVVRKRGIFLIGMHIAAYSHTGYGGHDPYRDRKLLLHHREIRTLAKGVSVKGQTIVPLRVYFQNEWAKVEIALASGKRRYDKKAAIVERDRARELRRELKEKRRA